MKKEYEELLAEIETLSEEIHVNHGWDGHISVRMASDIVLEVRAQDRHDEAQGNLGTMYGGMMN